MSRSADLFSRAPFLAGVGSFLVGSVPVVFFSSIGTYPIGSDTFFHAAVARDYAHGKPYETRIREGVLAECPADREPLFHLALAGLIRLGVSPLDATRAVSAIGSGALTTVVGLYSRSWVGAVCCSFGSSTGLFRRLMGRPQSVAVPLTVLGVVFLSRGRYRRVAVLSAVYALSYSVPLAILAASVLYSCARTSWAPFFHAAAGLGIGLVAHPGFPDNVVLLWYQGPLVLGNNILGNPKGLELPAELNATSFPGFLRENWGLLAVSFTVFLASRRDVTLMVIQAGSLIAAICISRMVEYWAPFAALSAGPAIDALIRDASRPQRTFFVTLFLVSIVALTGTSVYTVVSGANAGMFVRVAQEASDVVGEGYIATPEWDAYPVFRHFTGATLTQGLDPLFFACEDPERYVEFLRATAATGGSVDLAALREQFGADYLLLRRGQASLGNVSPLSKVLYEDRNVLLLELRDP